MTLGTEEVLQLSAFVLFWPRKVITAAGQVGAAKSARLTIKLKIGRIKVIDPGRSQLPAFKEKLAELLA